MRKSRLLKQVFSMLLVITMIMSVFNFSVLAEESSVVESTEPETSSDTISDEITGDTTDEATDMTSDETTLTPQESEVDFVIPSDMQNLEDSVADTEIMDIYFEDSGQSEQPVMTFTADDDENMEITNDMEYVPVSSADELEEAIAYGGAICIMADFELDRTFYITKDTYIYSDEYRILTRNTYFGGDIFVVGEDSDGTICENTVTLTLGNPESTESDLLTIDGNGDYMSADVTGTVVFIGNNAQADFYKNLSLINNKKVGNERTADSKYNLSYADQIGGAAVILASGTLNIYGSTFSNNIVHDVEGEASARGGAIYSFGALNIYGATFENNSAARGGALYNYRTTHIYNAEFKNNTATGPGGAIYMPASTSCFLYLGEENEVIESSVTFEGNSADENGGAIYVHGELNAKNTTFKNNTAQKAGGALYVTDKITEGKTITVSNSTFTENTSETGGGAVYLTGCNAEFNGTTFTGNETATHGGAIYAKDLFDEENALKVSTSEFSENVATSNAGAIYINNTKTYIADTDFSKNTSGEANGGGAIYTTKSTVKMLASDFTENETGAAGGAVYFNTNTEAELDSVTFTGNTATGNGGAVMLGGESTAIMNDITATGNSGAGGGFLYNSGASVKMYNSTLSQNSATGNGGAMFFATSAVAEVYKTDFVSNSATTNGGAMYIYTDGTQVTAHSCKFDSNKAGNYGGGAYMSNKSIVKMYNTTATGNSAANGGFLYETTTGTTLTVAGLTVSGNTATTGGPIIWGNTTGAVLNIDKAKYFDVDYSGETDDTYWASAIVNKLTVNDVSVQIPGYDDYEDDGGGDDSENPEEAITVDISSAAQMEQAIKAGLTSLKITADFEIDRTIYITNDTCIFSEEAHTLTRKADFAGDIFVIGEDSDGNFTENPVTLTVGNPQSDSENLLTIDGNKDNLTAVVAGTVFFVGNGSTVNLHKNVTVTNNKKLGNERTADSKYNLSYADQIGGAAVILASGTLNIYGSTFSNNIVHDVEGEASARGGAIYSFGALNIYGATFENNSAARGGALYNYRTTHIYNAEFKNNTATGPGGAIYMPASTVCFLYLGEENDTVESSVIFEGNSADENGGAIYVQGALNAKNTTFKNNTAQISGGALYVIGKTTDSKTVTVADSTFTGNAAVSNGGGAVYLTGCNAEFNGTTFTGNETATHGGAIYAKDLFDEENALKVSTSEFSENVATSNAGAIYINNTKTYIADTDFSKNTSGEANGGGAIYTTKSTVKMLASDFTENETGAAGGAVYFNTNTEAELDSVTFADNTATDNGGAVMLGGESTAIMNDITATGNSGAGGGFLYNSGASVKMYNSTLSQNSATGNGGAMFFATSAVAEVYKTDFVSNSATTNGGAMYIYTDGTQVTAHSCKFDSNKAGNYGGGAYMSNKSIVKMYNTTATGNSAANGGFLYETTTGTTVDLIGVTVSGNTATTGGPIIWGNSTGAVLNIDKAKYTDSDHTGEYDSTYWASAIVNKLTVYEVTQDIPKYLDYGNENYDEIGDATDVASAEGLEKAINNKVKNIRIVADFEIDRTFYITSDITIFSTIERTLTRKADFAGDMFIVGEDSEGNSSISSGSTAKLTLGNQYSETSDLLIIDGNSENMTVPVTGTVLFLVESGQIDIYKNVSIVNNRKVGNVKILDEKYVLNNANRVGGAAMIISDGTVNIYGAAFRNNVCNPENTEEGADESERDSSLGGAVYNRGTFNIYSGVFENNESARGGFIYNIRAFRIYSGQFIENHATSYGGAIYLAGSQYSQLYAGSTDSTGASETILFKNNSSEENGGALYCASMAIAVIYGDTTFDGNSSNSNGAAICSYGMINANNTAFKNNAAYSMGGAVYLANSSDDLTTRIVTLGNSTFENNTARNGGAIAVYASNAELTEGGIAEIKNCKFVGNKAINTRDAEVTSNVFGGAIYTNRKGSLEITDSTFEANEALFEGGAIYAAGESETTVSNSTFTNNSAVDGTAARGGAVSVHSAKISLDKATFEGNKATGNGGAVYVSYTTASTVDSDVDITNSTFIRNEAQNSAGAIYVTKHIAGDNTVNLYVANTTFEENTAVNKGGAILLTSKAISYLKNVNFIKNATTLQEGKSYGGAIYTSGASLEIDTATFSGNNTQYYGGGISMHDSSDVVLNNITADANTSATGAGFLFNSNGILAIYDSELKNNTAGGNGGAMTLYNAGISNIYTTLFEGNRAEQSGGAVYAYTEETETIMHSCTLKNNTAGSYGGGVYASNKTVLYMYNTQATENRATKGGFMYETVSGTDVTINTITVDGNTATEAGPIIYGNTVNAVLNIHKMNYIDLDDENVADESYWDKAIVNELTVNDLSGIEDEIPECETYIPKESMDEEEKERVPVPVDDVLSLGLNSSDGAINSSYGKLPKLDTSSNFMSRNTTVFENINGGNVTVDTFTSHANETANNCTVGEGLLIYQAILYKQAHPEENVKISIASFRFSTTAAVCINRNSRYFGYMRNLTDADYDKYGFVRISYLLVTAAKMGINVTVVGQLNGYPQPSSARTLDEYFNYYLDEPCDPSYQDGKVVGDFMNFGYCEWTSYDDKASTDMMHTKMCAVSHYLDMNGVAHKNAVWSSSSNLDGINSNATNGNNKMQTATIVSDHEGIYRAANNYIEIISDYCGQEDVYIFRTIVTEMSKNQIDLIKAGRADEIDPDEQIVYIGTENDDVFEFYFTPFGGDVMSWTESYNPYCKFIRKFNNSDDYVTLIWNNANYSRTTPIVLQIEDMINKTFDENRNPRNKIYTNLEGFDTSVYQDMVVGEDIGYMSFNKYSLGQLHSKDLQLSYSENGKREYVSILSSINMHGGAMSYQSNFVLVIKEDNCDEDSVFFNIADQTSEGVVEHTYGDVETYLPENENEDGYTYKACIYCDKVVPLDTVHRPGEWTVAKESTATENGISYQACKDCGEIVAAKEVVGKETDVTYTEGIKFSKSTDSRVYAELSAMPHTFESVIQLPKSYTNRAGVVVSNYEINRKDLVCLEIIANGKVRLYYRNNSTIQDCTFKTDVRSNSPKHIAVTVDGNVATLYVDGEATESKTLSVEYPSEYENMYIGGDDRTGNTQYFRGTIYSATMYSDVRTAEEIRTDAVLVPENGDNLLYSQRYPVEKEVEKVVTENTVIHPVAIPFDALTSYSVGNLTATPHTFEAIINVPTDHTDRAGVVVSNYNGGTGAQIAIEIYTNGRPRLYAYTGTARIDCIFATDIRSDSPRHMAITVNGKIATLYLDGEAVETKTISYVLPETTENFKIGGDDRSENAQFFKGKIQSVVMFSDVRTAEEIKKDAVLVTADAEDLVYSGYFTEKNSKYVIMPAEGSTFTKDNVKSLYDFTATPHTFDAVVQLPASVEDRGGVIVGNYKSGEKNVASFEIYSDGKVRLYYKNNSVAGDCIFDTDIRSDKPVRVTVTVEESTATLYLDGEVAETKTLAVAFPEVVEDLKIGGDNRSGNGQYFKGKIYSAAVYEEILSSEEIKRGILYNSEKALYSTLLTTEKQVVVSGEGKQFSAKTSSLIPIDIKKVPCTYEAVISVPEDVEGRAGVIVGNYELNATKVLSFEIFDGGRVRLYGKTGVKNQSIDCTFDTDIRSNKPVHVAITVDDLTATLYINGVQTETKTLKYALPDSAEALKIGGDNRSGNGQYFKGTIYSVALFSDVRSADEIALDVEGVPADADAVLYNTDFTGEICAESETGGTHIPSDWIIDREPAESQTGLKHTECTICGVVLLTKEYSATEGNGISIDFTALDAGVTFASETDAISVGEISASPRTFEAIFNLPKSYTQRAGTLVGNYDGGSGEQINVEIYNNGKPRLYYKNASKAYTYLFTTDIRSDSITHLAITVDGNTASLYLNGELKETVAISGTFANTASNFMIGADNRTASPQYFKGTIYGVNLFSDARTAEEIKFDRYLVPASTDGLVYSKYFIQ